MRPGHYRIYASRDSSFWCCGHTGLESPAKLGKFIYSHKVTNRHQEKDIRVNLFIPSILSWKEEGVELIQQSRIPESEQVDLTLNLKKKQKLILRIRKPDWTDKATFIINGEEEQPLLGSDGYWIIDRVWERKNVITLRLPMHIWKNNFSAKYRYCHFCRKPTGKRRRNPKIRHSICIGVCVDNRSDCLYFQLIIVCKFKRAF